MSSDDAAWRRLYPFPPNHLDLGGVRMHYVDEGHGAPVLLLHGNPTWSFLYRNLIKSLSARHRVIAPDHVGCGLSDKPQDYPYTLATHIDNVTRLVEHLGLINITLGVHDWGGAIGFGWATRRPDLVRRLIVFNTAAFRARRMPWQIRLARSPFLGALAVRGLNLFVRGLLATGVADRGNLTPDIRAGYLHPYNSYANRVAVHRFVQDIPMDERHGSYAALARIEEDLPLLADRPMLICWGARDFVFNDRFFGAWRALFPKAQAHRFADAGHLVLEEAQERIDVLARDFLDGHAPPPQSASAAR